MKIKLLNSINLLVILILLFQHKLKAQDYHFSQYNETPLLINPAQTALHNDIRIIMNYRNQWSSVTSPFVTYAVSSEFAINHKRWSTNYLGLGVQVLSDKAGAGKVGKNLALLSLNGILKVAENNKLSLGLIGGFGQRTVNTSNLQWGSQYDATNYSFNSSIASGETSTANSFFYPDLGAGIAWDYGKGDRYISANDGIKATVGIAAYHFGIPNYSYVANTTEKLNTKFVGHGNLSIGVANTNMLIVPEFIYVRQGVLQEINVGSMLKFITQENSKYTLMKKASAYSLGAYYRVGDAVIFTVKYEYSNYAIGISYDVNLSKLSPASKSYGGFEISLRFVSPSQFLKSRSRI